MSSGQLEAAAQALEDAADLIEREGHLQHYLALEGTPGHCAAGALNKVVTGTPYWSIRTPWQQRVQMISFAAVAVHLELDLEVSSIVSWNNEEKRTGAEVIEAFRHAAKNLRNEVVLT